MKSFSLLAFVEVYTWLSCACISARLYSIHLKKITPVCCRYYGVCAQRLPGRVEETGSQTVLSHTCMSSLSWSLVFNLSISRSDSLCLSLSLSLMLFVSVLSLYRVLSSFSLSLSLSLSLCSQHTRRHTLTHSPIGRSPFALRLQCDYCSFEYVVGRYHTPTDRSLITKTDPSLVSGTLSHIKIVCLCLRSFTYTHTHTHTYPHTHPSITTHTQTTPKQSANTQPTHTYTHSHAFTLLTYSSFASTS
jgi:hypothetical protein